MTIKMDEAKLQIVQGGKMAELALEHFSVVMNDKKRVILEELLNKYRSEDMDHGFMVGKIGELKALQDLEYTLDKRVKSAQRIDSQFIT